MDDKVVSTGIDRVIGMNRKNFLEEMVII